MSAPITPGGPQGGSPLHRTVAANRDNHNSGCVGLLASSWQCHNTAAAAAAGEQGKQGGEQGEEQGEEQGGEQGATGGGRYGIKMIRDLKTLTEPKRAFPLLCTMM